MEKSARWVRPKNATEQLRGMVPPSGDLGQKGKIKYIGSRTEDRTQNHLGTCSGVCERDIITIRPCDLIGLEFCA
jgi:hypothetical protein